jgi:hypothetical protein
MLRPLVFLLRSPKMRPITPIVSAIHAKIAPMIGIIPVRSTMRNGEDTEDDSNHVHSPIMRRAAADCTVVDRPPAAMVATQCDNR